MRFVDETLAMEFRPPPPVKVRIERAPAHPKKVVRK
jgi:hypothetical protein